MDEIIRIVNGSKLYGTNTEDSDDDFIGIYIESPKIVFSHRQDKSRPLHSRHATAKSQKGEVDGIAYSLRHFIDLAVKGNPTVLAVLFAPENFWVIKTDVGKELMSNSDLFVSMQAAPRFKGYMMRQIERFKGERTGHTPSRPELVEKYGYDVKYVMQICRLALQGIEFFKNGTISSPMQELDRNLLRSIRQGQYTEDEALELIEVYDKLLVNSIESSSLPEHPRQDEIDYLARELHEDYWAS